MFEGSSIYFTADIKSKNRQNRSWINTSMGCRQSSSNSTVIEPTKANNNAAITHSEQPNTAGKYNVCLWYLNMSIAHSAYNHIIPPPAVSSKGNAEPLAPASQTAPSGVAKIPPSTSTGSAPKHDIDKDYLISKTVLGKGIEIFLVYRHTVPTDLKYTL